MEYIPIQKEAVPYKARFRLEGKTFTLEFHYNAVCDCFTVSLFDGDEALAYGEPLIYGQTLFEAYADHRFPQVDLVPYDTAGAEDRVGWDNLGESVFLYVGDLE